MAIINSTDNNCDSYFLIFFFFDQGSNSGPLGNSLWWLLLHINLTWPQVPRYFVQHYSECFREGVLHKINIWMGDWVKQIALSTVDDLIQIVESLARTRRLGIKDFFSPDFSWAETSSFSRLCVCLVAQLCLTLGDPMDCSPQVPLSMGILQARIWDWVAISFSRGFSWPQDRICISCIAGRFFTVGAISYLLTQTKTVAFPGSWACQLSDWSTTISSPAVPLKISGFVNFHNHML